MDSRGDAPPHRAVPGDDLPHGPPQFHRLLALPEEVRTRYDLSSLQHMIHAAAPCPVDVKHKMIEWWGNAIDEYYAASEGGGTLVTAEDWLKKPGTVGTA